MRKVIATTAIVLVIITGIAAFGGVITYIIIPMVNEYLTNARIIVADSTARTVCNAMTSMLQNRSSMLQDSAAVIIVSSHGVEGVDLENWSDFYNTVEEIENTIADFFNYSFPEFDGTFILILQGNICKHAAFIPGYHSRDGDVRGFANITENGEFILQNIENGKAAENIGGVKKGDIVGSFSLDIPEKL